MSFAKIKFAGAYCLICSCFPFARKIPVRKRREQRLLAKDNKRRLNRFVNSPAPNVSKMRPKMRDIKLSFSGSGFDFFAVPTLFNVKKFCLITLQKSDLRKRNGVQEAAGSTPVTRAKKQSSQCDGCFFRSGDRDQRPLANSNSPLGVPNAKRRHAAGSTPVTRTNNYLKKY